MMETKSLYTLLKETNVIIPEIQREYVWGNNKQVLQKFLEDIAENQAANSDKKINIGFLYSYKPYEMKNDKSDIFLIDGQQRFTTLVLLAFCSAIKEGKKSDFDNVLKGHPNPAFSYRVRLATEQFLLDLFTKLEGSIVKKNIENQKWFLESYKNDASIKALLSATEIIAEFLNSKKITFDFVIKQIEFWYFNVGETSQGEELYITMNSRGESLTSSEQIKPLLFGKLTIAEEKNSYGKKWDNWEEYFYSLKGKIDQFSIDKIDLIMDRFLQTILQIENVAAKNKFDNEEINKIDLKKIEKYFCAFQKITNNVDNLNEKLLSCLWEDTQEEKYLFPFTALLRAIFQNPKIDSREIMRIYKIFRNAVRRGIVNHKPLLDFLFDYDGTNICEFILKTPKEKLKNVLDAHELEKIEIINNAKNKEKVESLFWQAQEHKIWNGNIVPLITWATKDGVFDFELCQSYHSKFNELFNGECDSEIDLTRRALLTRELKDYPRVFRGNTNYSFCWEYSDWQTLINDNVDKFKIFFDELGDVKDFETNQNLMIDDFDDRNEWSEFAKIPELLAYCEEKNIQWHGGDRGWVLVKGIKTNGEHANVNAYKLFLDFKKLNGDSWKLDFYFHEKTCVYFDLKENKTAIDIYYQNGNFILQLFRRDENKVEKYFEKIAKNNNLTLNNTRYESKPKTRDEIEGFVRKIMEEVQTS